MPPGQLPERRNRPKPLAASHAARTAWAIARRSLAREPPTDPGPPGARPLPADAHAAIDRQHAARGPGPAGAWRVGILFGLIYFVQGIGEPTEGLAAQPVRSILKSWRQSDAQIAAFTAILAAPWSLKPLYGLLSDFVPLFGSRRRSYLILASAAAVIGFLGVYAFPPHRGDSRSLLLWMLVPTAAVALADVVTDGLMIETAQPLGLTGPLQAVQWGCLYGASVLTGSLGGYLSERHRETLALPACAALTAVTLALAITVVREPTRRAGAPSFRETCRALGRAGRARGLWIAAAFFFLWNFNPTTIPILDLYMTRGLGLSEQIFGHSITVFSLGSIAACPLYALYSRRVPMRALLHASIVLGIAGTAAYALMFDERSALAVTAAVGLTYMTATLIQLDLAARICPPEVAATVFAILMALENLAVSLATSFGGAVYEWGRDRLGTRPAFILLLAIGAATTAACWLLMPVFRDTDLETADRAEAGSAPPTTEPCR